MPMLRYLSDVVTLDLNVERCIGCGLCAIVCPHGVFAVEDGKARLLDRDACMECGACARNCPVEAISVRAGVGCATALLKAALHGTEAACGCCGDSTPAMLAHGETGATAVGLESPSRAAPPAPVREPAPGPPRS